MMSEKQDGTESANGMGLLNCRTCLQELSANSILIDLFQCWVKPFKGVESTIAEDLATLANIQISETDEYPKVICESCCLKLQNACDFISCVRENDIVLRKRNNDYGHKIKWSKSNQIDTNVNKTVCENVMDIEIKQEFSEMTDNNKRENCESNEFATPEIKIEPEEFVQEHQNIKENKSSEVELTDMHTQLFIYKLGTSETNENLQRTKAKYEINVESQKDQNTSNFKHFVPDRIENKAAAAERSRLYRERHRKEINQRRREIRKHQQKINQINTASIQDVHNMDDIQQYSAEKSNNKPDSHTWRQRRYYQRHREEINQRRRDQRLKQSNSCTVPATAAERNRKYRERKKQEINERRRKSRQYKQKLQEIHAEFNTNDIDSTEQISKATSDHIQNTKNSTKYY